MSAVDYVCRRSGRRSLAIEITRLGEVVVHAPRKLPQAAVEDFVTRHEAWIARHREAALARLAAHPEPDESGRDALRRRAQRELPARLAYFGGIMGLSPSSVKITGARTRYGSCSTRGGICFSLYLMQYPPEAVDYVVVHELAHLKEHNHGPRFYALVASVLPDWRQRAALLKK